MELALILLFALVVLVLVLWPLQWAARAVRAERTGLGWCFLAALGAHTLHGLGVAVAAPPLANLVAGLLSALAFASILGTSFLRGVGIALLYALFSLLLLGGLLAVAGLSLVWVFNWP